MSRGRRLPAGVVWVGAILLAAVSGCEYKAEPEPYVLKAQVDKQTADALLQEQEYTRQLELSAKQMEQTSRQIEHTDRQLERFEQQLQRQEALLARSERIAQRSEALVSRQEKQADRYDKLLDRWEAEGRR